jgi:hypothetical protein
MRPDQVSVAESDQDQTVAGALLSEEAVTIDEASRPESSALQALREPLLPGGAVLGTLAAAGSLPFINSGINAERQPQVTDERYEIHERDRRAPSADASEQSEGHAHGHGTLTLEEDGRARYYGPTAGSEWLREVRGAALCGLVHCIGRRTDPRQTDSGNLTPWRGAPRNGDFNPDGQSVPMMPMFPFKHPQTNVLHMLDTALKEVPSREDAEMLLWCYDRNMSWK